MQNKIEYNIKYTWRKKRARGHLLKIPVFSGPLWLPKLINFLISCIGNHDGYQHAHMGIRCMKSWLPEARHWMHSFCFTATYDILYSAYEWLLNTIFLRKLSAKPHMQGQKKIYQTKSNLCIKRVKNLNLNYMIYLVNK